MTDFYRTELRVGDSVLYAYNGIFHEGIIVEIPDRGCHRGHAKVQRYMNRNIVRWAHPWRRFDQLYKLPQEKQIQPVEPFQQANFATSHTTVVNTKGLAAIPLV